jgi:hypothetical protein
MRTTQTLFRRSSLALAAVALTVLVMGPTNASAKALNLSGGGVLNAANAGTAAGGKQVAVTTTPPCISFAGVTPCATPAAITPIKTQSFDPMFGSTGTIKDVANTFPVVGFKTAALTVAGGPAIFDLINIPAPTGFPACTFTTTSGSCSTGTFILSQVAPNEVFITFTTTEIGYTGASATGFTPYIGVFTTQLSGSLANGAAVNIGNILIYQSTGGAIKSTWSATESPVPFTGCTVTQGGWGAPAHGNNPGTFLNAQFGPAYGAAGAAIGGLNTLTFLTAANVRNFLPQGGPPSFLNSSAVNPTSRTSAGVFAGQVLALKLNTDLEGLGGLTVIGTGTPFDGSTVSEVLAAANVALGGGALPGGFASFSSLNDLIDNLNSSFDGCVMGGWASAHLR